MLTSIQLAEISLNTNGIFYDEMSNRRAMAALPNKKCTRTRLHSKKPDPFTSSSAYQKNSFSAFDFNIEFEGIL